VNRTDDAIRSRLVELATTEFAGFNPVHLAETLADEGHTDLAVSPRTIRRILAAARTLEERLDGSLWVGADGQHHRLVEAPPLAPVLRARKLNRIEDVVPVAEPPAVTGRAPSAASVAERPTHPWRQYPAVRPR
jgi:hypothetical protein